MKKSLLILFVGMMAGFSACSKSEDVPTMDTGSGQEIIPVQFDLQVSSLAASSRGVDDVFIPTRYVVEVFKGADASGVREQHVEYGTTAQPILLERGQKYTFLFWADKGTPGISAQSYADSQGDYNVSSLKAVGVSAANNQPAYEAFCSAVTFTVGSHDQEGDNYKITLKHAVAKVVFKQADEDFTGEGNTLTVTYPTVQTLNVSTSEVLEEASGSFTHTFANIGKEIANQELGASYVFAPTAESEIANLDIKFNAEPVHTISNVPIQCNHRTVITGAYSNLYSSTFTVSSEVGDWVEDEVEVEVCLPHGVRIGSVTWSEGNVILGSDGKLAFGAPNSAGLFFKWGSLIGVTGNTIGNYSFYANNNLAFVPAEYTTAITDYVSIPYASETTFPTGKEVDAFKGYNTTGFNVATGKGDVCRYMSSQSGWKYGKWRLPTALELKTLDAMNQPYGVWNVDLTRTKLDLNKDGNFAMKTGYFVGTTVANPTDATTAVPPVGTIFMPASGARNGSEGFEGNLINVASYGGIWSSSPNNATIAYRMLLSSSFLQTGSGDPRTSGHAIRCVKDK